MADGLVSTLNASQSQNYGNKKDSNFAASKSDGMKNLTKIRRDVNCFSASDALIKVSFITFVV
jgi:hypothetical protein